MTKKVTKASKEKDNQRREEVALTILTTLLANGTYMPSGFGLSPEEIEDLVDDAFGIADQFKNKLNTIK